MILEEAKKFAQEAHEGQYRKYTGEPYVEHCFAVANMVESMCGEKDLLDAVVAAILHDTVEDCDVTFADIQNKFGDQVAEYVWYLTKAESFVGNRAQRKALDQARLGLAPDIVKFIKICDVMHNSYSIKEYDQKFWKTFRIEVMQLLHVMYAHDVWLKYSNEEFREEYTLWVKNVLMEEK